MKKDLLDNNKVEKIEKSHYESCEVLFFEKTEKKSINNNVISQADLKLVNPSLISLASNLNFLKSMGLDDNTFNVQKDGILKLFEMEMTNQIKQEESNQIKDDLLINNRLKTTILLRELFITEDRRENFTGLCKIFYTLHLIIKSNYQFIKNNENTLEPLMCKEMEGQLSSIRDKRSFTDAQQREVNKIKDLFSSVLNSYLVRTNDWSILSLDNIELSELEEFDEFFDEFEKI